MNAPLLASPQPIRLNVFDCPLQDLSLIEASAGTGKTWNICVLYLRLLLEKNLTVQQILVVTFTNAATAELRERIRSRIVQTLDYIQNTELPEDPFVTELINSVTHHTQKSQPAIALQLELSLQYFDEAAIYTIHGFCQRALSDTPLATGSPYELELITDDTELRQEAVADFWRRHVAAPGFNPLLASFLLEKKDSPEVWAQLLQKRQEKPLSTCLWPDPLHKEDLSHLASLKDQFHPIFDKAKTVWIEQKKLILDLLIEKSKDLKANIIKVEKIHQSAEMWDELFLHNADIQKNQDQWNKAFLMSRTKLTQATKVNKITPEHTFFALADALQLLQIDLKTKIESLRLELLRDMLRQAELSLQDKKRSARVLAFNDILLNAHQALTGGQHPQLALELRERFPVALIDEFQDTDPLQCEIFMSIYANDHQDKPPGPLFLVSDPKQSIYSFRNADVYAYLKAKQQCKDIYYLNENQRSDEGLINACNTLFQTNPKAFILPGIEYFKVDFGQKSRTTFIDQSTPSAPSISVAPMQLWWLKNSNDDSFFTGNEAKEAAAQATACEISRLLHEGAANHIQIGGNPLSAGDIAVLVRSHSQGAIIKKALRQLNINSVELSHHSIYSTSEAEELEWILNAILNPKMNSHTHTPLLAALSSQLMGLTAKEITELSHNEILLTHYTESFEKLRADWLQNDFGFMFRRWIETQNVSQRLLQADEGERSLTNLMHLGELLQRASLDHPGAEALVRWFAQQRRESVENEQTQLRLESDRNLVQIVTIHKSKGLEYPIVFCPFLWLGRSSGQSHSHFLDYHLDDGTGVIDFRPQSKDDKALKAQKKAENAAEQIRLIYVALTRAVHRCYLVAGCYQTTTGSNTSLTESAHSLLNWLAYQGPAKPYAQWATEKNTPETIENDWLKLSDRAEGNISLSPIPLDYGARLTASLPKAASLQLPLLPKAIDPGWHISSFSSLIHNTQRESAASDHDNRVSPGSQTAPEDVPFDDILRFSRGPTAGECLHALFETIDFNDPSHWDPMIDRALHLYPLSLPTPSLDMKESLQRLPNMLKGLLNNVIHTPLAQGVRLDQIKSHQRVSELEFNLRSGNLPAKTLNQWLEQHHYQVPSISYTLPPRYLKGFIDLVIEQNERFYLIDWKSNHLGFRQENYFQQSMQEAMTEHGYELQGLLYALALHRFLRNRKKDYDYEKHFGGALYLFIRGIRIDWQEAKDTPAGCFMLRPTWEEMQSLDALFNALPTNEGLS